MMKSNKGKTNFWSQLLLSMIAIFALPVAQGLEAPPSSNMSGENYQTSSEQHMLIAVREIRQALQVQPQPTNTKKFNRTLSRQSFLFLPLFGPVLLLFNFLLSLNEPIF